MEYFNYKNSKKIKTIAFCIASIFLSLNAEIKQANDAKQRLQ